MKKIFLGLAFAVLMVSLLSSCSSVGVLVDPYYPPGTVVIVQPRPAHRMPPPPPPHHHHHW